MYIWMFVYVYACIYESAEHYTHFHNRAQQTHLQYICKVMQQELKRLDLWRDPEAGFVATTGAFD